MKISNKGEQELDNTSRKKTSRDGHTAVYQCVQQRYKMDEQQSISVEKAKR